MKNVKDFFLEELSCTADKIRSKREEGDLLFALLTDSHISDNRDNTCINISSVDKQTPFSFVVHLGDLLCGNIPEVISRRILKEEIECYKSSVKAQKMYIAQGNHDGFRDENYKNQNVHNIMLNENWYADTNFHDTDSNFFRPGNKPWFYVDLQEHMLRLIFLCTNDYDHITNEERKRYKQYERISDEQLEWFGSTALNCPDGYAVMVFSHIHPFRLEDKSDSGQFIIETDENKNYLNSVLLLKAFKEGKSVTVKGKTYDFSNSKREVICWFYGHDHSDAMVTIDGITYVGVASQTAYIPQLWDPIGYYPSPRTMNTVYEDAWDAVLWKKSERKIYLTRFGAGEDRVIDY